MNRLLKGLLVTGAMIIGTTSLSFAKFNDVPNNDNYLKAIEFLNENGIINGYPDNTFKPSNKVTRAEFATVLVKTLKFSYSQKAIT